MQIEGDYYDGQSSLRHRVTLRLNDQGLQISGIGVEMLWPLADITVASPLGSIRSSIYLPDGAKCDFSDKNFARQLAQRQGRGGFFRGVHRWENSLKFAFGALVLTIVLIMGFVRYGLPLLAEQAAYAIPPAAENALGKETLQILDRALLEPSGLDPDRQAELEQLFVKVVAALDATERPYRLELRSADEVGANAFALPGGTVIMTDELIAVAENDDEIAAVLAHEVGHVRHRHAMRQVIQSSAVGLIVATLTGDVFSVTSMAATLPTMLVDADFSRDMERQADDVAAEYLVRQGVPVDHFATILTRIEQAHAEKTGADQDRQQQSGKRVTDYFSSHPPTQERIERLRQQ